jgi:hypothetical protein
MYTSQIQSGDGYDGNAFDLLKIISNDKKARMAYEAREADQRIIVHRSFYRNNSQMLL